MKIATNKSHVETKYLRSVFCAVHAHMRKSEGACPDWKRLRVLVTTRRGRNAYFTGGTAYVGCGPIEIMVGKAADTRSIVATFFHEMMHVYGYEHGGGRRAKSHFGGGSRCDPLPGDMDAIMETLPDFPVLLAVCKPVPRDRVAERYASMVKREKAWDAKLRRAKNALAKVKAERRTYERRHAAKLGPGRK